MAEDASLFVLLFGVPALSSRSSSRRLRVKAPRGGAVLCGSLLASVAPLLFGVDRVGYMRGAGTWSALFAAIAAIGLLVALVGLTAGGASPKTCLAISEVPP